VQLFVVPIKVATPSKSRDGISIRGEGCDTLAYCRSYSVQIVSNYVFWKLE
jgi:hypothetical protein